MAAGAMQTLKMRDDLFESARARLRELGAQLAGEAEESEDPTEIAQTIGEIRMIFNDYRGYRLSPAESRQLIMWENPTDV
jgi:hypothetical protein